MNRFSCRFQGELFFRLTERFKQAYTETKKGGETMNQKQLSQCCKTIWEASELRFKEKKSSAALADFLEQEGFTVERGIGKLATAFRAQVGQGRPVIGLLAEYDALEGLSQIAGVTHPEPRPGYKSGHGCGHHLLGCAVAKAACLVKEALDGKSGTIIVFGCPAEEGGSGKTYMARAGLFDELDCALTWHPSSINTVISGSYQANVQLYFHFHGVASHAAGSPHLGRSALDAVELMNVGVNFLREHIEDSDRIHYALIDCGGKSPNVVQAAASVLYLIRSENNEKASALVERVKQVAQGAALMTETTLEIEFDKACSSMLSNPVLENVLWKAMQQTSLPHYDDSEKKAAEAFKRTISEENLYLGMPKILRRYPELQRRYLEEPLCTWIVPYEHSEALQMGSTDVSDVSRVTPTAQFNAACYCMGTLGHSWQLCAQGLSAPAWKGMDYAAEVLKTAVLNLLDDPQRIAEAKAWHLEKTRGEKYHCPIPEEVLPKTNY